MYDIAPTVQQWLAGGRAVRVVRLVRAHGISSRWPGAAAAVSGADTAGTLLAGALDGRLPAIAAQRGTTSVDIADADATAVGLSCGGRAELFVQDAADVPAAAWQRLADRQPVTLVTDLATGATGVQDDDRIATTQVRVDDQAMVAAYRPAVRWHVVGDGLIADTFADIAAVLGWRPAGGVDALGPGDALVVLSHDPSADVPALADALTRGVGYVGALGSRRTQARRADELRDRGVDPAGVHGPAGLDIGSATPAEIALAIAAEALAVLRGAPATSLRDRSEPVHADGAAVHH